MQAFISKLLQPLHLPSVHLLAACLQVPRPVVSVVSRLLGPLLADQQGPSIVLVSSNPAGGAAAGSGGGGLYGGPAAGLMTEQAGGRQQPGGRGAAAAAAQLAEPSAEAVDTLVAMGFSRNQAMAALRQSGNDVQTAIALLVGGS